MSGDGEWFKCQECGELNYLERSLISLQDHKPFFCDLCGAKLPLPSSNIGKKAERRNEGEKYSKTPAIVKRGTPHIETKRKTQEAPISSKALKIKKITQPQAQKTLSMAQQAQTDSHLSIYLAAYRLMQKPKVFSWFFEDQTELEFWQRWYLRWKLHVLIKHHKLRHEDTLGGDPGRAAFVQQFTDLQRMFQERELYRHYGRTSLNNVLDNIFCLMRKLPPPHISSQFRRLFLDTANREFGLTQFDIEPKNFYHYSLLFFAQEFYKTLYFPECPFRIKTNDGPFHEPGLEQFSEGLLRLAKEKGMYPPIVKELSFFERRRFQKQYKAWQKRLRADAIYCRSVKLMFRKVIKCVLYLMDGTVPLLSDNYFLESIAYRLVFLNFFENDFRFPTEFVTGVKVLIGRITYGKVLHEKEIPNGKQLLLSRDKDAVLRFAENVMLLFKQRLFPRNLLFNLSSLPKEEFQYYLTELFLTLKTDKIYRRSFVVFCQDTLNKILIFLAKDYDESTTPESQLGELELLLFRDLARLEDKNKMRFFAFYQKRDQPLGLRKYPEIFHMSEQGIPARNKNECEVILQGNTFPACIDTGSSVCLMSEQIADRLFAHKKRHTTQLSGIQRISAQREVLKNVPYTVYGFIYEADFIIEHHIEQLFHTPVVLSREALNKFLQDKYGIEFGDLFQKAHHRTKLIDYRPTFQPQKNISPHIRAIMRHYQQSPLFLDECALYSIYGYYTKHGHLPLSLRHFLSGFKYIIFDMLIVDIARENATLAKQLIHYANEGEDSTPRTHCYCEPKQIQVGTACHTICTLPSSAPPHVYLRANKLVVLTGAKFEGTPPKMKAYETLRQETLNGKDIRAIDIESLFTDHPLNVKDSMMPKPAHDTKAEQNYLIFPPEYLIGASKKEKDKHRHILSMKFGMGNIYNEYSKTDPHIKPNIYIRSVNIHNKPKIREKLLGHITDKKLRSAFRKYIFENPMFKSISSPPKKRKHFGHFLKERGKKLKTLYYLHEEFSPFDFIPSLRKAFEANLKFMLGKDQLTFIEEHQKSLKAGSQDLNYKPLEIRTHLKKLVNSIKDQIAAFLSQQPDLRKHNEEQYKMLQVLIKTIKSTIRKKLPKLMSKKKLDRLLPLNLTAYPPSKTSPRLLNLQAQLRTLLDNLKEDIEAKMGSKQARKVNLEEKFRHYRTLLNYMEGGSSKESPLQTPLLNLIDSDYYQKLYLLIKKIINEFSPKEFSEALNPYQAQLFRFFDKVLLNNIGLGLYQASLRRADPDTFKGGFSGYVTFMGRFFDSNAYTSLLRLKTTKSVRRTYQSLKAKFKQDPSHPEKYQLEQGTRLLGQVRNLYRKNRGTFTKLNNILILIQILDTKVDLQSLSIKRLSKQQLGETFLDRTLPSLYSLITKIADKKQHTEYLHLFCRAFNLRGTVSHAKALRHLFAKAPFLSKSKPKPKKKIKTFPALIEHLFDCIANVNYTEVEEIYVTLAGMRGLKNQIGFTAGEVNRRCYEAFQSLQNWRFRTKEELEHYERGKRKFEYKFREIQKDLKTSRVFTQNKNLASLAGGSSFAQLRKLKKCYGKLNYRYHQIFYPESEPKTSKITKLFRDRVDPTIKKYESALSHVKKRKSQVAKMLERLETQYLSKKEKAEERETLKEKIDEVNATLRQLKIKHTNLKKAAEEERKKNSSKGRISLSIHTYKLIQRYFKNCLHLLKLALLEETIYQTDKKPIPKRLFCNKLISFGKKVSKDLSRASVPPQNPKDGLKGLTQSQRQYLVGFITFFRDSVNNLIQQVWQKGLSDKNAFSQITQADESVELQTTKSTHKFIQELVQNLIVKPPQDKKEALKELEKIKGIGKKTAEKLYAQGITGLRELADADPTQLQVRNAPQKIEDAKAKSARFINIDALKAVKQRLNVQSTKSPFHNQSTDFISTASLNSPSKEVPPTQDIARSILEFGTRILKSSVDYVTAMYVTVMFLDSVIKKAQKQEQEQKQDYSSSEESEENDKEDIENENKNTKKETFSLIELLTTPPNKDGNIVRAIRTYFKAHRTGRKGISRVLFKYAFRHLKKDLSYRINLESAQTDRTIYQNIITYLTRLKKGHKAFQSLITIPNVKKPLWDQAGEPISATLHVTPKTDTILKKGVRTRVIEVDYVINPLPQLCGSDLAEYRKALKQAPRTDKSLAIHLRRQFTLKESNPHAKMHKNCSDILNILFRMETGRTYKQLYQYQQELLLGNLLRYFVFCATKLESEGSFPRFCQNLEHKRYPEIDRWAVLEKQVDLLSEDFKTFYTKEGLSPSSFSDIPVLTELYSLFEHKSSSPRFPFKRNGIRDCIQTYFQQNDINLSTFNGMEDLEEQFKALISAPKMNTMIGDMIAFRRLYDTQMGSIGSSLRNRLDQIIPPMTQLFEIFLKFSQYSREETIRPPMLRVTDSGQLELISRWYVAKHQRKETKTRSTSLTLGIDLGITELMTLDISSRISKHDATGTDQFLFSASSETGQLEKSIELLSGNSHEVRDINKHLKFLRTEYYEKVRDTIRQKLTNIGHLWDVRQAAYAQYGRLLSKPRLKSFQRNLLRKRFLKQMNLSDKITRCYREVAHLASGFIRQTAALLEIDQVNMEYLQGFETFGGSRSLNKELSNWIRGLIAEFLEYKLRAVKSGAKLSQKEARYTSKFCSVCGHIGKRGTYHNVHGFIEHGYGLGFSCTNPFCPHFRKIRNADLNASRNIAS